MVDLPSGIVTFLFTDVEGSTLLWERDPDAMRQSLEVHDTILNDAITTQDGVIFKTVGDAFHAVFADADKALQAAIAIQRRLSAAMWGATGPLKVRIGLHTGPTELRAGEYISHTLNRASRVKSAAHGGQILLTSAVADQVGRQLPDGASLRDIGQHYLKGMIHPEHLVQAVVPDLPSDFPPIEVFYPSPHNLPMALTSFIGREVEIKAVENLLQDARLVILTGSGGVGKTRLAIEVGRRIIPIYSDGIWLIELAALTDPRLVPQTAVDALGIREAQDRSLIESLKDYLYNKRALLIFDNCEHLIEACAHTVNALLQACPRLTILVSSREALGLPGEHTFLVPNLSLPGDEIVSIENVAHYEALQLFIDRAQSALPGFELGEDNIRDAVQICQRLDGIPLAIELAAARMKTLRIDQIAQRLDDRFRLLTGGSRTALPRQQTLRATIDWSYGLLPQAECHLLLRLSVFSGGCTLKAAEAICPGEDIKDFEILDLLSGLVNKSMVAVDREQGIEPRFHLLETIRQYAREKLFESGAIAAYRDRHLRYFLEWAELADPETRGSEQAVWLELMDQEQENLMAALEWAVEMEPGAGLRLASALWWFSWMRNKGQECVRWLSNYINNPKNEVRNAQRGNALGRLGFFLMMHPKHLSQAEELAQESLAISREFGDQTSEAFALFVLGYIHNYRKFDYASARSFLEQSMTIYQSLDDQWGLGRIFYNLGIMEGRQGHTLSQREYLEKSLAVCRQAGDVRGIAIALDNLAAVRAEVACDLQGGRKMVEEAIELYHHLKASGAISNALLVYGHILSWQGDYQTARAIFEELNEVLRQRGGAIWKVEAKRQFAFIDRLEGKDDQAAAVLEDCLAHLNTIDPDHTQYQIDLIEVLTELGLVLTRSGDILQGRRLLGEALTLASTPVLRAKVLHGLGLAATAQEDGESAAEFFLQSLKILQDSSYRLFAISALEDHAGALHQLSQDAKAVRILGSMASVRQQVTAALPPGDRNRYETLLADLQTQLGEGNFHHAWTEGQALTLDEAIEFALEAVE
jgi:predicted ATPase/class 3 adenylate cyclase